MVMAAFQRVSQICLPHPFDDCDHAGSPRRRRQHQDSLDRSQLVPDDLRCALLLERQLGRLVELTAQRDNLAKQLGRDDVTEQLGAVLVHLLVNTLHVHLLDSTYTFS